MRAAPLVVTAVVCLSSLARAQESPPPSPPPAPAQEALWSVGAGAGFGGISLGGVSVAGFGGTQLTPSLPTVNVSVERKLRPRTSLVAGLAAGLTFSSLAPETQPTGFRTSVGNATQSGALSVGVRQVVLGESALVALSVHGLLTFGYSRTEALSSTTTNGTTTTTSSSVSNLGVLGLVGGFGLERSLMQQLALRLTVGVLSAAYNAGRTGTGGQPLTISGFTLGLTLQPALELRMYF